MAKEEPKRLFSKVAKFVRNPLKDWSELDDPLDPGAPEVGYSREMLKEMIERRQRNDFVRRREFDMLRKLRRREAAGGHDAEGNPSSFNVNSSTSGKNNGRALTLKKIDEIEEQMSQQWWKNRSAGADGAPEDLAGRHARAYADTVPGAPLTGDAASGEPGTGPATVSGERTSRLVSNGAIEEASIRFAHGDDVGTEAILLQALAPDTPTADHDDTWRALLDLYRATGVEEKFVAAADRYVQRVKRPAPEWTSLRMLARDAQAAVAAATPEPAPRRSGADWSSPAQLTRPGLGELTRALGAAGPVWTLDWSALAAVDLDAAGPLRALFAHWAGGPVHLRFIGSDRLLTVLEEATPVSERGKEVVWWQLRMDALRAMHLADEFELAALNYCITYEVSPPPWEDAQGRYESVSDAGPARPTLPLGPEDDAPAAPASLQIRVSLAGELSGESLSTWHRLDAELADATTPTISCAALVRIDFTAAGTLLNWVMARDARGQRVHFVDAHCLIAPFFSVIGIADHATVALRPN